MRVSVFHAKTNGSSTYSRDKILEFQECPKFLFQGTTGKTRPIISLISLGAGRTHTLVWHNCQYLQHRRRPGFQAF